MTDVWIDIDLEAYRHNLATVRARVAPAEVMVVVKNDAYGHGVKAIVQSALDAGVTAVGVLDARLGVELRAAGAPEDVLLFAWLFAPDEDYREAISSGVDLGVSTVSQLQSIVSAVTSSPARIHLKIDTGLGRAGARPEQWPDLVAAATDAERAGAVKIVGVWTHISEASEEDDSASIALYRKAVDALGEREELLRHLAASAASFERHDSRFDIVRVGAFTYGIAPGDGISPQQLGLRPVMALRGRVTSVDSAGNAHVPIGLVDGMPSLRGCSLSASLASHRVAITEVEATSTTIVAPGAQIGDVVTFFGSAERAEPTLQEWADSLGTIGEEIVVRMSPRIERRYSNS